MSDPEAFGIEGVVDHDWYTVSDIVLSVAGSSEDRQWTLLNRCLAEARVLLARNWDMVEKVADELQRRGSLSGSEVSSILEGRESHAD